MNYLICFHKFTEQLINISVSQIICDQMQNKKKLRQPESDKGKKEKRSFDKRELF